MKKLFFLAVLLSVTLGFSQKKNPDAVYTVSNFKVTTLAFSVNSVKELKTINWDNIKEIFENNKNPDQKIELTFKVDLPESKNKIKSSITFGGESGKIDDLILLAKKGVKGFIRIINKNK